MTTTTTTTAARGILPPLTPDENKALASAILYDWSQMTRGKAGQTLACNYATGAIINAHSKPLDVIAFRMRQYRQLPVLFVSFVNRHNDGGEFWCKLHKHLEETYPEFMEG